MKGESTAVPGDRAWIDDLANEVALLVVVVKGEEHGLTGVPLFDQPSHVQTREFPTSGRAAEVSGLRA